MALGDFLYRCPLCGNDPVQTTGPDRVRCPSCETCFEAAPPNGESRIRVRRGTRVLDVQAAVLNRRIDRFGGASSRALGPDGVLRAEAEVEVQFISDEAPLRFRRRLLGFIERLDPRLRGILRLEGDFLELHPPAGEIGAGTDPDDRPSGTGRGRGDRRRRAAVPALHRWSFDDVSSLQTSSSAVQISLGDRGVVLFRFTDDSVRRWDDLIRRSLQRRWRELGRGEIREFQPRIRA